MNKNTLFFDLWDVILYSFFNIHKTRTQIAWCKYYSSWSDRDCHFVSKNIAKPNKAIKWRLDGKATKSEECSYDRKKRPFHQFNRRKRRRKYHFNRKSESQPPPIDRLSADVDAIPAGVSKHDIIHIESDGHHSTHRSSCYGVWT